MSVRLTVSGTPAFAFYLGTAPSRPPLDQPRRFFHRLVVDTPILDRTETDLVQSRTIRLNSYKITTSGLFWTISDCLGFLVMAD